MWFGIAAAIGNTISAGIVRTPGDVAKLLPNAWMFLGVWVLGGLYWLWTGPTPRRALLVVAAPVAWCVVDALVTGDPLFSLHSTSDLADELRRSRSFSEVPGDFVTPAQAAVLTGEAEITWRKRAAAGKIPGAHKYGKQWVLPRTAIAAR